MGNLSKAISTSNLNTKYIIDCWNNSLDIIKQTTKVGTREISPQLAEMYKFDLEGLFLNEFRIPKELIYPNIRLNGYDSSYCYDGKKLRFKLFNPEGLTQYASAFIRSSRTK